MRKKALITGITGQDGAYLAEFLLEKGYEVHGIYRRSSLPNCDRINALLEKYPKDIKLHYGDLTDSSNLIRIVNEARPVEIYNLAAQSHVGVSFECPEYTANTDALGPLRLLEAIRILGMVASTRFYQASTSELYGQVQEIPQKETTPFYPRSPYAVAKLYAYWIVINYREAYGIFGCNGILFNHESPLRGEEFVTRKITVALARILLGQQKKLHLGNLNAKRDWGHAKDYVEMQWLILQQEKPEDYVIASGQQHSVRDFVTLAARQIGVELHWEGVGLNEKGIVSSISPSIETSLKPGDVIVAVDPKFFRPTEVETLLGDASKAKNRLNWEPKISFEELVAEMAEQDFLQAKKECALNETCMR